MNWTLLGIAAGIYIIAYPLALRLLCSLHTRFFIRRVQMKTPKARMSQLNLPDPLWPKISERMKFSLSDSRPFALSAKKEPKAEGMETKKAMRLMWLLGLAVMLVGAYLENWKIALASLLVFVILVAFGIKNADPIIKGRQALYKKMFDIIKSTVGVAPEVGDNPHSVIQVEDWRDILKPTKIRFEVPTTFSATGIENFMRLFNQVFGQETTWVGADDPENGKPAWNFEDGYAVIKEVPPLPIRADWSEHYVLDQGVAWSFFPVAVGVENGVPVQNPNTGETEHVLGFDLSGEQPGLSAKMGVDIGAEISTAPMALCLTGDTQLVLGDGSLRSIGSLAEEYAQDKEASYSVLTLNKEGRVVPGILHEPRKTRTMAEIVKVDFTGGESITCTPDHLFGLADGSYIRADRLRRDSELAPINGRTIKVHQVSGYGRADVYDAAVPGVENFLIGFKDSPYKVKVHNCAGGTGGGKALSVDTTIRVVEND